MTARAEEPISAFPQLVIVRIDAAQLIERMWELGSWSGSVGGVHGGVT
jgi:hypothetical protein